MIIIPNIEILKGTTFLVVDNSKLVYRAMRTMFRRFGIESLFAARADEVIPLAIEHNVDAIILDINLPNGDGIRVCKALRENDSTKSLPLIVLTGLNDPEHHIAALDSGADDFVGKPPQPQVLLRRISTIVAQRRAEEENQNLVQALGRYISPATINQAKYNKGVERITATLLFSDMRGFTAASYSHDAADVFTGINDALGLQSEIVRDFGGYVDGFSGDGMIAVFDSADSTDQALLASAEIIKQARVTDTSIWNPLPIGIGLNRGEMIRGDLGSESRCSFTVIGSAVNVSARLCGVAKAMQAVASQSVVEAASDSFTFEDPTFVNLKGLPKAVPAYTLIVP